MPGACMDPCPPDTEAVENDGAESGGGNCEEEYGGEEEYECVSGGAGADAL